MQIKNESLKLRAIEENDLKFLYDMLNDPLIENEVAGWSFPVSMYNQKKWFESTSNDRTNVRLIVEVEKEPIGLISLNNIDMKNRKASLGIKLSSINQGKGYGMKTINLLCRYAFYELGLNRLDAKVLESNIKSNKLFIKLNFKQEGTERESIFKNNQFINQNKYALLKKEYESLYEQTK